MFSQPNIINNFPCCILSDSYIIAFEQPCAKGLSERGHLFINFVSLDWVNLAHDITPEKMLLCSTGMRPPLFMAPLHAEAPLLACASGWWVLSKACQYILFSRLPTNKMVLCCFFVYHNINPIWIVTFYFPRHIFFRLLLL